MELKGCRASPCILFSFTGKGFRIYTNTIYLGFLDFFLFI